MEKDLSTEEKIKQAAKKIFQQKGYGLARTRDIANEAGINLALLNYYFRGKRKLYEVIMKESMREMFTFLLVEINNESTSLAYKIEIIVNKYINLVEENPNLPLFVIAEMQTEGEKLFLKAGIEKGLLKNSYFFIQLKEHLEKKKLAIDPSHIFINIVSLSIFPLLSCPLVKIVYKMEENEYNKLITDRRILIPKWLRAMIQLEE